MSLVRGRPRGIGAGAATRGGSLLVNLAAAPFVNRRPVQRFTLAAWLVAVLLVFGNAYLWLQYRADSMDLRERLADTRGAIESKSQSVVEMDGELRGLRLDAQNAQVRFLNERIAERTFPWSLLFERIASTLPDGVRLNSLNPVFGSRDERAGSRVVAVAAEEEQVSLKIQGVAKSDQDLYELIDAFFQSPGFERPRLYQESRNAAEVEFTVDVQYFPRWTPEPSPSGEPVSADAVAAEETHRPAVASAEEAEELGDAALGDEVRE